MKIRYTVHTVAPYFHSGPVTEPIHPVTTVELVSDEPGQTNPILHVPADSELAKAQAGDIVTGTFVLGGAEDGASA